MWNNKSTKREREYTDSVDENTNCEKQRAYSSNDIQPISYKVDWAAKWPEPTNASKNARSYHLIIHEDGEWQIAMINKRKRCDASTGSPKGEKQRKVLKNEIENQVNLETGKAI